MREEYLKAQQLSYAQLENSAVMSVGGEYPLGFQPLGIASQGSTIAIADYFAPAICLADVIFIFDKERINFTTSWIRSVKYRDRSVRLFPSLLRRNEANRAQTVVLDGGNIWVSRNGDRTFFKICREDEGWKLTDSRKKLPGEDLVHSATLATFSPSDLLLTVESTNDLKKWFTRRYDWRRNKLLHSEDSPPFVYGIACRNSDLWTITDYRSNVKLGIYCNGRLAIPDICGNGLCFLSNGSLLVTRYGQSSSEAFSGKPGALIHVRAGAKLK